MEAARRNALGGFRRFSGMVSYLCPTSVLPRKFKKSLRHSGVSHLSYLSHLFDPHVRARGRIQLRVKHVRPGAMTCVSERTGISARLEKKVGQVGQVGHALYL